MTWRRFVALLEALPLEATTTRRIAGPTAAWSTGDYLLALLVDMVRVGNWQRGGGRGSRPKPIDRPGVSKGRTYRSGRSWTPAQFKRLLAHRQAMDEERQAEEVT